MLKSCRVAVLALLAGVGWSSATLASSYGGAASVGCNPIPCGGSFVE